MSFPAKVKLIFKELESKGELSKELAENLCDITFCRDHGLQTQFSVLSIDREKDIKGHRRYYPPNKYHLVVGNRKYLLTNNWFEKDILKLKNFFCNYLSSELISNLLFNETFGLTTSVVRRSSTSLTVGRREVMGWPEWDTPTEENIWNVAQALTPHIKFLHPAIVESVVESNRRLDSYFREFLSANRITASSYFWDGCSTMFPGVRRANGNTDKEYHKKQLPKELRQSKQAIYLDDNSYPKHIWAFIFTGREFSNQGPKEYELAHLFEHKAVERLSLEIAKKDDSGYDSTLPISGMFTNVAGIVYAPRSFVKISDHSLLSRRLLQRRALQLYGEVSEVLPPSTKLRECREWSVDDFNWGEPVGDPSRVELFLNYRVERIKKVLTLQIPKR